LAAAAARIEAAIASTLAADPQLLEASEFVLARAAADRAAYQRFRARIRYSAGMPTDDAG
jgi:hypothetical protein